LADRCYVYSASWIDDFYSDSLADDFCSASWVDDFYPDSDADVCYVHSDSLADVFCV
jgi:hypothetical protein